MKHLTVAIATESQILAAGVKAILAPAKDVHFSAVHVHPADIRVMIAKHRPAAIIADAGDTTVLEAVRHLKERATGETAVIGLCHGALPSSTSRLFDGTISVYDGPDALHALLRRTVDIDTDTSTSDLTPREKEVVVGIVKGLSNKEIASEINVSVNTVMTHRRNIASKLRIHSAAGLTIYAIVSKLVSLDEIKGQLPAVSSD